MVKLRTVTGRWAPLIVFHVVLTHLSIVRVARKILVIWPSAESVSSWGSLFRKVLHTVICCLADRRVVPIAVSWLRSHIAGLCALGLVGIAMGCRYIAALCGLLIVCWVCELGTVGVAVSWLCGQKTGISTELIDNIVWVIAGVASSRADRVDTRRVKGTCE